jgi:glutamine amidotransferase
MMILDYGVGNVGSIVNMLTKVGVTAELSTRPEDVLVADRLILPGVGAFDAAMTRLRELGYEGPLSQRVLVDRVPILGICLGMQLLGQGSEEGKEPGFGWLAARAVRFRSDGRPEGEFLRVPHMGWNAVRPSRPSPFFPGPAEGARFYFVHSYHLQCDDEADVMTRTTYGEEFVSAVCRDNIVGAQFHPEKSHRFGLQFFRAFVEWRPSVRTSGDQG